jgi:hypothetical protein
VAERLVAGLPLSQALIQYRQRLFDEPRLCTLDILLRQPSCSKRLSRGEPAKNHAQSAVALNMDVADFWISAIAEMREPVKTVRQGRAGTPQAQPYRPCLRQQRRIGSERERRFQAARR